MMMLKAIIASLTRNDIDLQAVSASCIEHDVEVQDFK